MTKVEFNFSDEECQRICAATNKPAAALPADHIRALFMGMLRNAVQYMEQETERRKWEAEWATSYKPVEENQDAG